MFTALLNAQMHELIVVRIKVRESQPARVPSLSQFLLGGNDHGR